MTTTERYLDMYDFNKDHGRVPEDVEGIFRNLGEDYGHIVSGITIHPDVFSLNDGRSVKMVTFTIRGADRIPFDAVASGTTLLEAMRKVWEFVKMHSLSFETEGAPSGGSE